MIEDLPLEYNLENQALESKFQAKLSKIVKYYDSLARCEEVEAVKILMSKIKEKSQNNTNRNSNRASHDSASTVECTFCGKNSHVKADCRTKSSEFTNHTDRPYIGSEVHKRMVKIIRSRE